MKSFTIKTQFGKDNSLMHFATIKQFNNLTLVRRIDLKEPEQEDLNLKIFNFIKIESNKGERVGVKFI